MKLRFYSFLATLAFSPSFADATGIWAAIGQTPFVSSSVLHAELLAPDRLLKLVETANGLAIVGKHTILLSEILSPPSLTEVVWSPDSKAFVVNASDGGVVGTWDAYYYSLDRTGRWTSRNLANLLAPMIDNLPHCDEVEKANVGVIRWLDEGRELLVVAEAPPHSSCRNMGAIRGFRVSVSSWRVVGEISEVKLRRNWGRSLGPRFTAE